MPKKQNPKDSKKESKDKPLSVHSMILNAAGPDSMSRVLSRYNDAGWELMAPPVPISIRYTPFSDRLDTASFLVILRKKPVQ